MAAPSRSKPMGVTGYLGLAFLILLLAGVVWLRLAGDESAAISTAAGNSGPGASSSRGPRAGDVAPGFTLETLDGQPVSLSEWRGRPVLINFWASWCGPCKEEMPAIQAAYEEHREHGLVVLAVAVDDRPQDVRRFVEEHGLTFEPLIDDGGVSHAYRVLGLPTSVFVGPDGRISAVHTGPLDEDKIETYLRPWRTLSPVGR